MTDVGSLDNNVNLETGASPNQVFESGPPPVKYLPMRYVTWEQYGAIWPDDIGSIYPIDNHEYPVRSIKWTHSHNIHFKEWLLQKNIEAKWFHQDSPREMKVKLMHEFCNTWDGFGEPPYPQPNLLIRLLHWLNRIMRMDSPKEKSKRKQASQEMATMAELFEGYEQRPIAPPPQPTLKIYP